MSRLDPHSLEEGQRWFLFLCLQTQRLLDRGVATSLRGPVIMTPKLVKQTEQMIRDYPQMFDSYRNDDTLFEMGMKIMRERYGIEVDREKVLELVGANAVKH